MDEEDKDSPPVKESPVDREELTALMRPEFHRFFLPLMSDWLVIVAAYGLAARLDHWVAYAAAVLVVGTRQHAIGVLGHDGAHRLGSRTRWLNNAVTQLFIFWPLVSDLNGYRRFHFPHHRFLNTPRDPEMVYRKQGEPEWDVPRSTPGIAWRLAKDLVGLGAFESLRLLYISRPLTWHAYVVTGSFHLAVLAVAYLTGTLWIAAVWYLALFTSFAAVWRVRCWVEHLGTDDTHRVSMSPWLAWWIAPHNVWYHWEHHKWPALPHWNLPRARALDDSVPVVSLWELFRFYATCLPVKSGVPTLDGPAGGALKAQALGALHGEDDLADDEERQRQPCPGDALRRAVPAHELREHVEATSSRTGIIGASKACRR